VANVSTFFRQLWKLPGFRRSFRAIEGLPPESLSILKAGLEGDRTLEELAGDVSAAEVERLRAALSALTTLRGIRDTEGLPALLEDISQTVGQQGASASKVIEEILVESPQEALQRRIEDVQRSGLPVLTRLSVDVDLRVAAPEGTGQSDFGLVPVLIIRLEFDETIAGQDAIVFQVTEEEVDEFTMIISSANKLRKEVVKQLPSNLLLRYNGD
jgi:hypothetical protein